MTEAAKHTPTAPDLRDWFAAQALPAIMQFGGSDMWNGERQRPMAMLAYEMADEMLAARAQGKAGA